MTRRFVIGVEGLNQKENGQLRDYLDRNGSWWHWIDNLWLFVTNDEEISCSDLRSFIGKLGNEDDSRDRYILVMEIPEDIDWSVRGKKQANGRHIGNWLKKKWVTGPSEE